ncbi:DUF2691 family protein [[Clostridium] fimetarium]|uniref:DUF2691 family protein n=1 Tax=[Clostridium] fimetarium TaxID=99656 RepID=A0A1I0QY59_9FIRM|nr:DUF2691 family protein [[Clostridium] fimetarium]SEW32773.1 Protein of unknown function [[Clostridium] fimetarium]
MRGISFKVNNGLDNYLYPILSNLDFNDLQWFIDEDEVYQYNTETKITGNFFVEHILNGASLLTKIMNEPHYIIFLNLIGFTDGYSPHVINNYNEYLSNINCQIVVLVCDSIFVDIYCKSINDIELIKKSVVMMGCSDIKYITDENDIYKTFDF